MRLASPNGVDIILKQAVELTMAVEGRMTNITSIAAAFFEACEAGKGWEGCRAYCLPNATFAAQSEPLAEIRTLQAYTEWMKGLLSFMPDGRYEVKSFATDADRNSVCAYGVFFRDTYRRGRSLSADRPKHPHRVRLRDGVRRRQSPSHDQDLECGLGYARTRVGIASRNRRQTFERVNRSD